jgi:hypothetical protein
MGAFDWLTEPLSGLLGGGIDAAVSAKMAAQNRQFQERMTRHRYRYQMEDMKAAGLNPMLAFGQSPPAAPGGAMPSMQSPVTSGIQAASALATQKLTAQQARKTSNEADLTGIQAYAAAMGLEGVKGAEAMVRDLIDKYGQQMKNSAQDAWRNQTRVPTPDEIHKMHGSPGYDPRYDLRNNASQTE